MAYGACALHGGYLRPHTHTRTHVVQYSLLFHCNNSCKNAALCYVICTLPVLLQNKDDICISFSSLVFMKVQGLQGLTSLRLRQSSQRQCSELIIGIPASISAQYRDCYDSRCLWYSELLQSVTSTIHTLHYAHTTSFLIVTTHYPYSHYYIFAKALLTILRSRGRQYVHMDNWKAFRTTHGALTERAFTTQMKFLSLSDVSYFRHHSALTVTEQITESKRKKIQGYAYITFYCLQHPC